MSTTSTATAYWCYDCDMSVSLLPSPSPHCPHCHTHSLHSMDPNPTTTTSSTAADDDFLLHLLSHLADSQSAQSAVDSIPTVVIKEEMIDVDSELGCVVCREGFGVGELVKELPCKHLYHPECIRPWLSVRSSCPLCRFELPPLNAIVRESTRESIPNFREMMMEDQDSFRLLLRQSGIRVTEDAASLSSSTQAGEEAESWLNWSVFEQEAHGDGDSS